MTDFQPIVLTLPGLPDPGIAIAASRAGGVGILDLEHVRDQELACTALARLTRFGRGGRGVKLDPTDDFAGAIARILPDEIRHVVLLPGEADRLQALLLELRRPERTILLQVTDEAQAELGEALEVDGLIAKGSEAGGWVGEETGFILLQRLLGRSHLPVFAQGGIGVHTAAACRAAGAAGVVLEAQMALTRESALPEQTRAAFARLDGSETICLGVELGYACRMYAHPGHAGVERLRELLDRLLEAGSPGPEERAAWRSAVRAEVGEHRPGERVWLVGQDAAFAAGLAARFRTVGGVLEGIRRETAAHLRSARELRPLAEDSPLALSHGTRYPIVQGPMTRVSDTAEFALQVAEAGALPFLALALMPATQVEPLLADTTRRLHERPWGVGVLGFVPPALRREQLEVIRRHHPSFALIAGGRPDQALHLESAGIPTYLHVPSPELLRLFFDAGARRFVWEGRECGGHVGPRSSFVLWEQMIQVLLELLTPGDTGDGCHVLFAGGIHDALSASMVATLAVPLAERGVRTGVLMGTAYLFTREAVVSGAIVEGFQEAALACERTVLLESGPGHSTRCADTSYAARFGAERRRLALERVPPEEAREALESLNLGRLRLAAKAMDRHPDFGRDPSAPRLAPVSAATQREKGMYMLGQLAALRDRKCTISELHRDVADGGTERLLQQTPDAAAEEADGPRPCDLAIVGMSCRLPEADDTDAYWENILAKVDAIREIPRERFDWERYFDPDPAARDRIYSRWGGFLEPMPFDPLRYGMPPSSLSSIEPMQLLMLEVVRAALADAGYAERPFPRERTAVILGVGGGIADLGQRYALRSGLPLVVENVSPDLLDALPEWTEDSFAGILLNVTAGRVANRFDLGGANYTVDAACASSLAAVYLAARELETGASDMVIVGGADTVQNPFGYLSFSKTAALSPTGRCRTFDENADGIAISEGLAVVVLKRLADAERDGDRIYAVLKGVAGSSDGRARGLTAPRPEGQVRALERAYRQAGASPATVQLVEAHGTGTVAGDQAEIASLKQVFAAAGAARQACAVGSVKSMIGHTKCTAGVAGLIKVALALHHRVLPPTLNVTRPNPKAGFPESPFYVNTEARPWIAGTRDHPRRAGVSAFGFGGTNFHAVLEEYAGEFLTAPAPRRRWPAELCLWAATDRAELLAALERLDHQLAEGARPELRDLAFGLWRALRDRNERAGPRLAIVADSLEDLRRKMARTADALRAGSGAEPNDPRGVYITEQPLAREGKVAFLFPGQGSQYPDMLRELAIQFPEVRERFDRADAVLAGRFPRPLSALVFPPPRFEEEEERAAHAALTRTDVAQPALGAAGLAIFRLLGMLGVQPELIGGHSYGEYVALCAAGVMDEETLIRLSEARGRYIVEEAGREPGIMAAVEAGWGEIQELCEGLEGVWLANRNAPRQTIISGTRAGVEEALARLGGRGISARPIPVACAFHSPLVAPARDRLAESLRSLRLTPPRIEVFSNSTAAGYPSAPPEIAALLAEHLVRPVDFLGEVEAMYRAGGRIFVEVGPRNVLTALTSQILQGHPHLALSTDVPGRSGLSQLLHAVGQLVVHGVAVDLEPVFRGRAERALDPDELLAQTQTPALPPTTWMVTGGSVRPLSSEPPLRRAAAVSASAIRAESSRPAVPAPSDTAPDASGGPPAPPASAAITPSGAEAVMLRYQEMMRQFVETQTSVMLSYLDGSRTTPWDGPPAEVTTPPVPENMPSAPVPTPPPPPQPEPSAPVQAARSDWGEELFRIVAERTGYPAEMLDLDAHLEADLGIDSIKRVEILGALQRRMGEEGAWRDQPLVEALNDARTLRDILARLANGREGATGTSAAPAPVPATPARPMGAGEEQAEDESPGELARCTLEAVVLPPADPQDQGLAGRLFLVTDEEGGIAVAVVEELRRRGGRAALLGPRADRYRADLTDPNAVAEQVAAVRDELGPISGLVHLLALQRAPGLAEMSLSAWRASMRREVKSLHYLARAAAPDLRRAASDDPTWLLAATALDRLGQGGAGGGRRASSPGAQGLCGLVKTLSEEWPEVRGRVVDLELDEPTALVARRIVDELALDGSPTEVIYHSARGARVDQGFRGAGDRRGTGHYRGRCAGTR